MRRVFTGGLVAGALFAVAVWSAALLSGAPGLQAQPYAGLPDLGPEVGEHLTMRVHGVGGTFSTPEEPTTVESTEDGRIRATFVEVRYAPATAFAFYWDGVKSYEFVAPEVVGLRWRYTVETYISADTSFEVVVGTPEGIYTWCGISLGYCRPGEAAAYSTPECTKASHDPEYLKLYKPGSGPACVHHIYKKPCNGCPLEVVE